MKIFKHLTVIVTLFVLNFPAAYAKGGLFHFDKYFPKKVSKHIDRIPCANFSGQWKSSSCIINGNPSDDQEQITIVQHSCTAITFLDSDWGDTMDIGGTIRRGETMQFGDGNNNDSITEIKWNPNRQKLMLKAVLYNSSLDSSEYVRAKADEEIYFSDGKLINYTLVEGESYENGVVIPAKWTITCTYDKAN